ncbi:MAG TPA: aldehyde dehydrogenase EutE [Clostridiales bacterium]|nr:aldehyde dehydrogenase EutE [Clostridiales bacterium]
MNQDELKTIVQEVVLNILREKGDAPCAPGAPGQWMFEDANDAVAAAMASQKALKKMTLEKRGELIEAMRHAGKENAEYLAKLACEETGYGIFEHKVIKNNLAATKTPGIEDLKPTAYTGDYGMTLTEGAPFGVVGSITPSTNPTSTVINNSISMIAAGNAVAYNPHPAAKHCSQETMRILNEAIVSAGGPPALISTVRQPSLESGQVIMEHKNIPILSVTGGEAVVAVAMKTGKKVIAAGPGNPPVVVDETADIKSAARDIADGASFDNNIMCIAEKEVFAVESVFDKLVSAMEQNGCLTVRGGDIDKIVSTVLVNKDGKYVINREYVGKPAAIILRDSGVHFTGDPRLVIAEVDAAHPFVRVEMLMPVLGMVRVRSFEEAVEQAVIAEQGCGHSAMIHSTNIHNMSYAATEIDTTIFVKNAPSYAGVGYQGEGYATLTIATPTGEGLTSAKSFTRSRRCILKGDFRII